MSGSCPTSLSQKSTHLSRRLHERKTPTGSNTRQQDIAEHKNTATVRSQFDQPDRGPSIEFAVAIFSAYSYDEQSLRMARSFRCPDCGKAIWYQILGSHVCYEGLKTHDNVCVGPVAGMKDTDYLHIYTPHTADCTDFKPGTLDLTKMPQISVPDWVTETSKKEMSDLVLNMRLDQDSRLWYVDFDKMDNMFQWFVEFHSFPPHTFLAKDMGKAGLPSTVVEVRFPRGYPSHPPFIRVVCPRILPFKSGVGTLVTIGGGGSSVPESPYYIRVEASNSSRTSSPACLDESMW